MEWCLIRQLQSKSSETRRRAAERLGLKTRRSERALQGLITLLKDRDFNVRTAAAVSLGKLKAECAVSALSESLRDFSHIDLAAIDALESIANLPARNALLACVKSSRRHSARYNAADSLIRLGYNPVTEEEKAYFAMALMQMDTLEQCGVHALGALIAALDGPKILADKAEQQLIHLSPQSLPVLTQELNNPNCNNRIISVLEQIGGQDAIEALSKVVFDKNHHRAFDAAKALARIADEQSIKALVKALISLWKEMSPYKEDNYGHGGDYFCIRKNIFGPPFGDGSYYETELVLELGYPAISELLRSICGLSYPLNREAARLIEDKHKLITSDAIHKGYIVVSLRNWDEVEELGKNSVPALLIAIKDRYSAREAMDVLKHILEIESHRQEVSVRDLNTITTLPDMIPGMQDRMIDYGTIYKPLQISALDIKQIARQELARRGS